MSLKMAGSYKKCMILAYLLKAFGFNYWKESGDCEVVVSSGISEKKDEKCIFTAMKNCERKLLSRWTKAAFDNFPGRNIKDNL